MQTRSEQRRAPQPVTPAGTTAITEALWGLPRIDDPAGFVASALDIAEHPDWGHAVEQLRPIKDASHVRAALDHVVDAYRSSTPQPLLDDDQTETPDRDRMLDRIIATSFLTSVRCASPLRRAADRR